MSFLNFNLLRNIVIEPTQKAKDNEINKNNNSIENEIDWKIIDQLHNAANNFSKTTIEVKKLLFVVIGISSPIIVNLCDKKLDKALFLSLYIFVIIFWLFDSFNYYYQEKLRESMDKRFERLKRRNSNLKLNENDEKDEFTLPDNRIKSSRFLRSIFNVSNLLFYGTLLILISLAFLLFYLKKIG